jgi:putative ABC transport system substrate-binding protein
VIARRAFVCAVGAVLLANAAPSPAQQQKAYVIGILTSGTAAAERQRFDDFTRGLRDLGYVEGSNIRLEKRYADGRYESLPALARDLVQSKVDVIMCMSTLAAQAAKQTTGTIPIVFATVADPVASGFAESLARPGGNMTGVSNVSASLGGKQLQVLKDAVPTISRVAIFTAPRAPHASAQFAEVEGAAKSLRMEIHATQIRRREDIEPAVRELREWRANAMYVMQGAENSAVRDLLVEVAERLRVPAIYPYRNYVEAGGLMSYGSSFDANYYRAASFVDRILKGGKPAEMPIEQPTKFEFVVNSRTAKALALTIPQSVLMRADEVIQ